MSEAPLSTQSGLVDDDGRDGEASPRAARREADERRQQAEDPGDAHAPMVSLGPAPVNVGWMLRLAA